MQLLLLLLLLLLLCNKNKQTVTMFIPPTKFSSASPQNKNFGVTSACRLILKLAKPSILITSKKQFKGRVDFLNVMTRQNSNDQNAIRETFESHFRPYRVKKICCFFFFFFFCISVVLLRVVH